MVEIRNYYKPEAVARDLVAIVEALEQGSKER